MEDFMQAPDILRVSLKPVTENVKLDQLGQVSRNLQHALSGLAIQMSDYVEPKISYDIVGASVGSLSLALRAVPSQEAAVDPAVLLRTFTDDLIGIREERYRPGLTPSLTKRYLRLVRTFGESDTVAQYDYVDRRVCIDKTFRAGFEVALKERIAEDVVVTGYLEAVNAHRRPFTFYLYPKLEQAERIECRFHDDLLSGIAELLKQRTIVQVTGRAYYMPVGLYPVRIELEEPPRAVVYDPDRLRSYVGALNLLAESSSVADYLSKNREAAGLGD